jgi:flagellar biosynthesis GTPase FlhF
MSGGIFISYRRGDSAGFAGRIYDRVASRLNRERVFFDVDNIELGADFVRVLSGRVAECDALIVIIGKNWLSSTDEENRRRLDDPDDFVRIEIETALQRNIPVIPVLVDGAAMPRKENLPEALKPLARRQGLEISHPRFDSDSEQLTKALAFVEAARVKREHAAAELEERQREGAETAKRAEEDRRKAEAEAAQRAEDDRRRCEAAEAAKRAEEDRRTTEAEAARRAEDERRRASGSRAASSRLRWLAGAAAKALFRVSVRLLAVLNKGLSRTLG